MSKQAKFFCENCQTEVDGNAKFCPNCGRFFSSVKCPKCGKIGSTAVFKNGCPECGYSGSATTNSSLDSDIPQNSQKRIKNKKNESDDSLPFWIYILAISVLVLVVVMFILFF